MGGSSWSDDHYRSRATARAATHTPTFAHDVDVKTGKTAVALHPSLNIHGVKFRESRDSDAHSTSRAVAVLLDVTGSMADVPKMIQAKLPTLMGLLLRKAYLEHPHILVGAIGDAHSDKVPIQIGQFEAGIEIDDQISNLYLEGGGGGQDSESYELAMYFMAYHTAMDCFEKRGEKGYLFIVGDERFYPNLSTSHIHAHIGNVSRESGSAIPTAQVIKDLCAKFEVFFVMPNMTGHYGDASILECWKKAFGERVLLLNDPNGICELIASTIAVCEGTELGAVEKDLKDAGTSLTTSQAVSNALTPYAKTASGGGKAMTVAVGSSGAANGLVEV